ncbi:MAG: hypothetical protein R3E97_10660 [Candidatus Eisenbacteria bacterium]
MVRVRVDCRLSLLAILSVSVLVLALPSNAQGGGAHEGGTLLVHASPDLTYTSGFDYVPLFDLTRCEDAVTSLPASEETHVWWVVAAFPPSSSPLLAGVSFSVAYSDFEVVLVDAGSNADFEIHSPDWPGPSSGTTITWSSPRTEHLVPVYWFAGYQYGSAPAVFRVTDDLRGGQEFADGYPPLATLDEAVAFGSLTLGGAGEAPACPQDLQFGACSLPGQYPPCRVLTERSCREIGGVWTAGGDCGLRACCLPNGVCQLFSRRTCEERDGEFLDGSCEPFPCDVRGACCLDDSCEDLVESECLVLGGTFRGGDSKCESIECQETCAPNPAPLGETMVAFDSPNAGGTLILHHDPDIVFSSGPLSYCSRVASDAANDVTTRIDVDGSAIFFVLAAFPEDSQPDLAGVDFGIYYPDCITVLDEGSCADFDHGFADWPSSGSGVSIAFDTPQQARMVTVHWFEAEIDPGFSAQFELGPQPNGQGRFYDSEWDYVAVEEFGTIGFHSEGYFPRPRPIGPGACCLGNGCEVLERLVCESQGGEYQGPETSCSPETCPLVPTIRSSWGQIKGRFHEAK